MEWHKPAGIEQRVCARQCGQDLGRIHHGGDLTASSQVLILVLLLTAAIASNPEPATYRSKKGLRYYMFLILTPALPSLPSYAGKWQSW